MNNTGQWAADKEYTISVLHSTHSVSESVLMPSGSRQVSYSAGHSGSWLRSCVTSPTWAHTAGYGLRPAGHRERRLQVKRPLKEVWLSPPLWLWFFRHYTFVYLCESLCPLCQLWDQWDGRDKNEAGSTGWGWRPVAVSETQTHCWGVNVSSFHSNHTHKLSQHGQTTTAAASSITNPQLCHRVSFLSRFGTQRIL